MLVSCDLPAELKAIALFMEDKGISGIGSGAFKGLAWLRYLSLDDNHIATIEPGAFEDSPHLWSIALSSNHTSQRSIRARSRAHRISWASASPRTTSR